MTKGIAFGNAFILKGNGRNIVFESDFFKLFIQNIILVGVQQPKPR